jgi:putative membrane protein
LSGEWLWRVSGLSETLKYNLRALPGTIMKTLVLCVDRDDDLGTKAGMNGPVIGREENLKASVSLGLADPEEVDTNTILAGLQIYDDLMKRGMDAEIATIAGDTHVGFQSDLILTNQLENVLEVVKPDRAILVSDGAEDEAVYPVISSRVKVDFVKRVYVKQSRSIEGTYYMIIKTLQDEKIRRKWIMPVSLLLIIFGSLSLFTKVVQFSEGNFEDIALLSQMSPGIIGIVLGLYLVGWAYHWADRFQQRVVRTKRSIRQGSLAIPFTIVAMVLGLIGMMIGYDTANVYGESLLPGERSLAIMILKFVSGAVWFIVFGVFAYETGKSVTAFLRTGRIKWSFIVMMVSVLATGFIIQGAVDAMLFFVSSEVVEPIVIFAEMITGILIALFSSVLYASLRSEAVQQALAAEGA